jgi:cytoskeletal protein RodZ
VLFLTELGSRLKDARKAKGLSLDDLQNMTKIQKRYLKGIEEGNYDIIPGKFYVRAFIKQYAETVGLESDQIFDEFKSEVPTTHNEELTEQISRVQSRKTVSAGTSKVFNILPTILVVVFILAAAFLVWVLVQKYSGSDHAGNSKGNDSNQVEVKESGKSNVPNANANSKENNTTADNNQTNSTNNNSNDSTKTQDKQVPVQELKVVSSSGGNSTYKLSNTDKFNLNIASNGKSWVLIKNGKGHSFYQGLMNKDDKQTVDLTKESEVIIRTGNAASTDIYLNNQKLDYAVSPTDIVVQNITIQFDPLKTK